MSGGCTDAGVPNQEGPAHSPQDGGLQSQEQPAVRHISAQEARLQERGGVCMVEHMLRKKA